MQCPQLPRCPPAQAPARRSCAARAAHRPPPEPAPPGRVARALEEAVRLRTASVAASAPPPPAWLASLLPAADAAALVRRDPGLLAADPAAAVTSLRALRELLPGRDVDRMVSNAPQLLRQAPDETRALLERLRAHFRRDVAQMVANRPQLLLRGTNALIDEWQRRPVAPPKRKPKAAAAVETGATSAKEMLDLLPSPAAPAGADEDANAVAEAAAAARAAFAEIAAAGRPMPRCFGASPLAPAAPAAPAPDEAGADEEVVLYASDDEGSDGEAEEEEEDEAAKAEFEAVLAAATAKARAARAATGEDQVCDLVARIEARWASRKGIKKVGLPRKSKGSHSERRRAREKVAAPWLAAPWVLRQKAEAERRPARLAPVEEL